MVEKISRVLAMACFGVCFSFGKDNTAKQVQDFLQALNAVL